jgi:hypothetical protein
MSQSIISRTIGAQTDLRAKLTNGQLIRNLSVLDNWNHIRLGLQLSFDGVAAQAGTPILAFGMNSGNALGYADAGANFLGIRPNVAITSWLWNAGAPAYFNTQSTWKLTKSLSGVVTDAAHGGGAGFYFSSAVDTIRSALLVDITKGAPNYTINSAGPQSTGAAQTDVTDALFLTMMEATNLSDVSTIVTGYAANVAGTIAFDEVAGLLDSICIYWDKTATPCEISSIRYRKIS